MEQLDIYDYVGTKVSTVVAWDSLKWILGMHTPLSLSPILPHPNILISRNVLCMVLYFPPLALSMHKNVGCI